MTKEFCKCGHSKASHLIEFDRTVCCSMWQSRKTGYVTGCECSHYEAEKRLEPKFKCDNCNEEPVEHKGDFCDNCNLPERSAIK